MAKLGNSKSRLTVVRNRLTVLRNYIWAILSLWTVFVVLVLLWGLSRETFATEEVARIHGLRKGFGLPSMGCRSRRSICSRDQSNTHQSLPIKCRGA
jgi:hypothetical protein